MNNWREIMYGTQPDDSPETEGDAESKNVPAAWYQDPDGPNLRYWDGDEWTSQRMPKPPKPHEPADALTIAGAAMVGVLAALFLVWVGAQIAPTHVYLPVKFVVSQSQQERIGAAERTGDRLCQELGEC